MVQIRECQFGNVNEGDPVQIDMTVVDCSGQSIEYLTEKFVHRVCSKVTQVIFADFTREDLSMRRDLNLLVQVWRYGRMIVDSGKSKTATLSNGGGMQFKRAVASTLISLVDLIPKESATSSMTQSTITFNEISLKLFDGDFLSNFDSLAKKQTNKLTHAQNCHIIIAARLLVGDLEAHASPGTATAQKCSFGDVIVPGHVRNDLYFSLESSDFEKGGKSISKNIEAVVSLVAEGGVLERAISGGVNDESVTFYK